MINKDKLKSMISKKAKGNNTQSAQLYQMFFFEHILERLSKSEYKHNIILKGGLLLASIVGEDERTTKDMDATLKSQRLETENVYKIIDEIINIDIEDEISFEIVNIEDIRKEDKYGGFKIGILAKMNTLRVHLVIELTTGDKITPREIEYNYNCVFENKKIPILAYTIETIMAEKYQTIISRGKYNTRMKDFYDIYILINEDIEKIETKNLMMAIENTFKYRKTEISERYIKKQINEISNDTKLTKQWKQYQKTAPYAQDIKFEDINEKIEQFSEKVLNYFKQN